MYRLFLVGIGPGGPEHITPAAIHAMTQAQLLCGYGVYIDLVRPLFPDKPTFVTPMRREMERCRFALEQAQSGRDVAMLCSGDAGIYGMAGPILQLAPAYPQVEPVVIPGITAAVSGAALLGAPLMNDFCVISLSDLLTPWETIAQRLEAAALGDFTVCLYNPASRKRPEHLRRACEILLKHKPPQTVCGWARSVGREGESFGVTTLERLQHQKLDMFTTVFIGSRETQCIGGRMITPRGYGGQT